MSTHTRHHHDYHYTHATTTARTRRSLETRLSQSQAELAASKEELGALRQSKVSTHAELAAAQEECAHLRWDREPGCRLCRPEQPGDMRAQVGGGGFLAPLQAHQALQGCCGLRLHSLPSWSQP